MPAAVTSRLRRWGSPTPPRHLPGSSPTTRVPATEDCGHRTQALLEGPSDKAEPHWRYLIQQDRRGTRLRRELIRRGSTWGPCTSHRAALQDIATATPAPRLQAQRRRCGNLRRGPLVRTTADLAPTSARAYTICGYTTSRLPPRPFAPCMTHRQDGIYIINLD